MLRTRPPRIRIASLHLVLWPLPYLASRHDLSRAARAPFWPGFRHPFYWYLKG